MLLAADTTLPLLLYDSGLSSGTPLSNRVPLNGKATEPIRPNQEEKVTTDLGESLDVLCQSAHSAPVVVVEKLHHRRVDGVVRGDGAEEVGILLLVGQDGSGGSEGELGGGKGEAGESRKSEEHLRK